MYIIKKNKNNKKEKEILRMKEYWFVRVGAIVNKLVLASPFENAKEIVKMIRKADKEREAEVEK